ncbi:MAG: hypothetical protein IH624_20040 [Phycisphaerae bacterium]|nr:hypothetical protein [Phycisphaerae bacterium]
MISLLDIPFAARRPNLEGDWIEIVIPVLIIIVYAISGIVKMRSNLKEQQKEAAHEEPRYEPLDEASSGWDRSGGEVDEREAARLERLLEVKPMPQVAPAVTPRHVPEETLQHAQPQQRRTLDAFLATPAPKPLAERIAEARAKAEAQARPQAESRVDGPLWPRASERQQVARTRKPKVPAPPASAAKAAVARPAEPAAARQPSPALDDLREMDNLRRAIIFSEILARPVAFRDMDF